MAISRFGDGTRMLGIAALVLASVASTVAGQGNWRVPVATGGAATASLVGMLIDSRKAYCEPRWCGIGYRATMITGGAGAFVGWVVGSDADRKVADSTEISDYRQFWLRLGTFMGPAALGTQLAYRVITPPEAQCVTPPPGSDPSILCVMRYREPAISDETVALLGIGGGALVGFLLQRALAKSLEPRLSVSQHGAAVSLTYTW